VCTACATRKLILRPSYLKIKVDYNSLNTFKEISVVLFIHQLGHLGTSWYLLMHLLDGPMYVYCPQETMLLHGSLLKLSIYEHIIMNMPSKPSGWDNAAKFTSHTFNDYCMSLGINAEHCVPYVHTQNELVESLIKRIKLLIARSLLQNCNLPTHVRVLRSYTQLILFK
jgi:hypothetical protein